MSVRNLEPKEMWNHFADLNAVPRPSKKEERVIQFMIDFGKSLGLETKTDAIQNVIIKKPASPGMENRKTVILQSHLDMVHQKNADTVFDFDTQGIEMIVEGDWVRANGTTLGADNGIGVATIMAVLASDTIQHPAIEAMFTIDEETGMTGAMQLDGSNFKGEILLNLDTEDDDELSIGCAGGIDTNTKYTYAEETVEAGSVHLTISIRGLLGGHSGMDIDKGRGNANKLMNRILYHLLSLHQFQLISIDGGSLRNAIPRESTVVIAIAKDDLKAVKTSISEISEILKHEYKTIEQALVIAVEEKGAGGKAVAHEDMIKIVNVLYAVPNGVFRMSPDIEGLVETSSSLARVIVADGNFVTQSLQRSSVESTKADVANAVRTAFETAGVAVVQTGDYPGWQPNPNSEILTLMHQLYVKRFNEEPQIKACHAGLECGILGKHLPGVDMISFGPNIRAAHSPDEKVQISSVQKFWGFFLEVLQQTPVK
ncbi:aminoacyl-histidine dipeptidase [Crocinitomicaceae bacterium CZZ-1]|uniref:Cytosol non-specific dipeptidase n=1 Tax=Taishania pollutisoli TaxID=2766479 RepID=A0A8J6TS23_9FLAO|nr:aminoacyl-histidine dipeptidase [Taishania pollutisoli]MBC9811707.1 aminoacyl-histidine dipeptidase [Taishania pollutisoli]MBX2948358.1 aminoacyl-histidine dipeptidase [Crocinitomicaceae bacterium]NGF75456.1 aminoacyl-histidine dipeptidase [Fluviicola sp. SGL-29]